MHRFAGLTVVLLACWAIMCLPAARSAEGPPEGFRKILEKYDANKDGRLDEQERRALQEDVRAGKVPPPPQFGGKQRPGGQGGPGTGGAQLKKLEIQRDVEYGRAGDRVLKLDLARPKQPAADRLPAIVFIHGGGWRNGDKAGGIARVAPLVAEGNYVGVSVGYRLSGEALWPAQIHDCKAAIRWVRANAAKYGIDPDHIGVWGSSAGGHLVNMLGASGDVKQLEGPCGTPGVSSRVQAVVAFCGPADFVGAARVEGGREPSAVSLLLGGTIDEKPDVARQASPITYVSKDDPPFLLMHGTEDKTVPFEQAARFREALQKAGVNVTLVPIEGGGHSFGGPEVSQRVKAFLDKTLRGQSVEVPSTPIRAADNPAPKRPASK